MSVKTTADRLMAIPCKGYWDYNPDGNEFDCEYPNATDICENCVCNIGNCYGRLESHRNTFNPITGKRVGFKVVKRIFAIKKDMQRETGKEGRMIDWNDTYYHRCEFCRHCGPTTSKNTGDGPVYKCWCRIDGIPGPLHDYYGKACNRWERTTRFDKEETR